MLSLATFLFFGGRGWMGALKESETCHGRESSVLALVLAAFPLSPQCALPDAVSVPTSVARPLVSLSGGHPQTRRLSLMCTPGILLEPLS